MDILYRLVCPPSVLERAPEGWPAEMLRDGEVALLPGSGGMEAVDAVGHALGLTVLQVLRREETPEAQEQTVTGYADGFPLVWVDSHFSETARAWAKQRGPMTLLVEATDTLPDDERRRVERFVALLGRQAE